MLKNITLSLLMMTLISRYIISKDNIKFAFSVHPAQKYSDNILENSFKKGSVIKDELQIYSQIRNPLYENKTDPQLSSQKKLGNALLYIGIGAAIVGAFMIDYSATNILGLKPHKNFEIPGYIVLGGGAILVFTGIYIKNSIAKQENGIIFELNPLQSKVGIGWEIHF